MKKLFKVNYKLIYILLVSLFIVVTMFSGIVINAFASSSYSSALEDLRKDETFNFNDYPAVSRDYSLHVIQLAESEQGELLIYTYQPAGRQDVRACSINIAREMDNSVGLGFKNYVLEYLNSDGVFFKYRVKDFELKPDVIRYYNVSNILRPFDKLIDDPASYGQTIQEVPYAVGQFWTAVTYAGEVSYTVTESEVIEITEKYVGHINYDEGQNFGFTTTNGATSAHFVAFNTDKPIEKLISASVTFNERDVQYKLCGNIAHTNALNGHTYKSKFDYVYGDKTQHEPVKLTSDCKVLDVGKNKYMLNRIRTTSEFIADAEGQDIKMTSGNYASVEGTKWVLNFYETAIEAKTSGSEWSLVLNGFAALFNGVGDIDCRYSEVSDVMVLQLEFETDGKHYNLGVVDNKQTGNQKPWGVVGGMGDWLAFLPWWVWLIIGIVFLLIVLSLLSLIFPAVWGVFKIILKAILFVITAPFRFIVWVIRKIRGE